jgi:hemerythrin-like metal-binding protein
LSLLTWNHASSVGVRALDDQHGILMDTTNELRLTLLHGGGREQVCEILDRLIEFTRMHFQSEEKLMEDTDFPGLIEHRAEHHRMLATMLQSAHCLQHSATMPTRAMLCALRDGYIEHIEGLDQEYGPWLNREVIY